MLSLNCTVTLFPHLSGVIFVAWCTISCLFLIMYFFHFLVGLEGRLYTLSGVRQFICHLASFVSRKRMLGTDFSLQSPFSLQISGSLFTLWLQISDGFKWKPRIWSFSSGKDALFSFSHFLRPEASIFFIFNRNTEVTFKWKRKHNGDLKKLSPSAWRWGCLILPKAVLFLSLRNFCVANRKEGYTNKSGKVLN